MIAPQVSLDEATDTWGIKVERVEMYVCKLLLLSFFARHKIRQKPCRLYQQDNNYISLEFNAISLVTSTARMCVCPFSCNVPWRRRLRLHARHAPR